VRSVQRVRARAGSALQVQCGGAQRMRAACGACAQERRSAASGSSRVRGAAACAKQRCVRAKISIVDVDSRFRYAVSRYAIISMLLAPLSLMPFSSSFSPSPRCYDFAAFSFTRHSPAGMPRQLR